MSKLRLDSWKAIADHMNRGVRTVQRWNVNHGLPVHRVGGSRGSVYAYANELDQWAAAATLEDATESQPDPVIEGQKRRSAEAERLASELWDIRSEQNLQAMLELYHSAIDQYPDNVAAIAGLANTLIFGGLIEWLDLRLAYPSIKAVLDKALQKDPRNLKVQNAFAWTNLLYEHDWEQADRGFTGILRVNPVFGAALFGEALLHLGYGNFGEASRFARASWSAEPMGVCQGGLASLCMVYAGDVDGAARLVSQIEVTGATCGMLAVTEAMVTILTVPPSEALTVVQTLSARHARSNVLRGLFGYTLAAAGQVNCAQQVLESLHARRYSPASGYAKALVMSGLGRIQEAVETLGQGESVPSLWRFGYRTDPLLAPLREDPKFQEMISTHMANSSIQSGKDGRAA